VVRRLLPPGIEPVDDMSGGINVYTAEQGYGLAPYTALYFYVHIKGFDSADGTKARWMLQGLYGPEPKVGAALRKYYGVPVTAGDSRLETRESSTIGIGTLAGQEVVRVAVTPKPTTCKPTAGIINFLGQLRTGPEIVVVEMPYVAKICDADPVSVDVSAAASDALKELKPVKLVGGFAFENFTFAFPRPESAQQVKARGREQD